jgi:O-methyltransferase involved in polyketide biosynthesis
LSGSPDRASGQAEGFLDDRLDQQLQLGYQQVVILGTGLDTRAIRKPAPDVAYFEIDDENILSFKKARLEENGIDANVRFIPGNYVSDGLIDLSRRVNLTSNVPPISYGKATQCI